MAVSEFYEVRACELNVNEQPFFQSNLSSVNLKVDLDKIVK